MVDLEYANRGRGLQTITIYTACSLDVERERRLVYGKVVPQLMAHARRKGVDFDYVDFRQGLKPGHTLTKTDLKLILREITNCNCFLAIIGSEMGEAAELPDELRREYDWLESPHGKGVTWMELMRACAPQSSGPLRRFLCFKDNRREGNPEETVSSARNSESDSSKQVSYLRDKLKNVKGVTIDSFTDDESLSSLVLTRLSRVIEEAVCDSSFQRSNHETKSYFIEGGLGSVTETAHYLPHMKLLKNLEDHLSTGSSSLVIFGEAGMGKSSLLAYWLKHNGQALEQNYEIVCARFLAGCSEKASDTDLLWELNELAGPGQGINEDRRGTTEGLIEDLPWKFANAVARSRTEAKQLLVVIDGFDAICPERQPRSVEWMHALSCSGVRLIVSTGHEEVTNSLVGLGWSELRLEEWTHSECEDLVNRYPSVTEYFQTHSNGNSILEWPRSRNPMFLRALLDSIALTISHVQPAAMIQSFTRINTIDEFCDEILSHLESTFWPGSSPELLRNLLKLLSASRKGLCVGEVVQLLELLGSEVPLLILRNLLRELVDRGLLVYRDGVLAFFQGSLRKAVERRYFSEPENRQVLHRILADCFWSLDVDPCGTDEKNLDFGKLAQYTNHRQLEEGLWQLQQAEDWIHLQHHLTDPRVFWLLFATRRFWELNQYWDAVGNSADLVADYFGMLGHVKERVSEEEAYVRLIDSVATFLTWRGHTDAAEVLLRRSLSVKERVSGSVSMATFQALIRLADLFRGRFHSKGNDSDINTAEWFLLRAAEIGSKVLHPLDIRLIKVLNRLAEVQILGHDYEKAEEALIRAVELCTNSQDDSPTMEHQESLRRLATAFRRTGEYRLSTTFVEQAKNIVQDERGNHHPAMADVYSDLGWSLYHDQGLERGIDTLKHALTIYEQTLGPNHPAILDCLRRLVNVLKWQYPKKDALEYARKRVDIACRFRGDDHPATRDARRDLAVLLRVSDETYRVFEFDSISSPPKPMKTHANVPGKEKGSRAEETPSVPGAEDCADLARAAKKMYREGDYDGAHEAISELIRRITKLDKIASSDMAWVRGFEGLIYWRQGKYDDAYNALREALSTVEKVLGQDHEHCIQFLRYLAALLCERKKYDESMRLLEKAVQIAEESLGRSSKEAETVRGSLQRLRQRSQLFSEGQNLDQSPPEEVPVDSAEGLYQFSERLYEKAGVEHARKNFAAAIDLYRRALENQEKALPSDHPYLARTLNDYALALHENRELAAAEETYRRALTIRQQRLDPEHFEVAITLNNLGALLTDMKKYGDAEPLLKKAIDIYGKNNNLMDMANSEINLQGLYFRWGKPVAWERVQSATAVLKNAGDHSKADKGQRLLLRKPDPSVYIG